MPATRFEVLVAGELEAVTDAMFKVSLGDSHRHAFIKGQHAGIQRCLELFKQSQRHDEDIDGDGI